MLLARFAFAIIGLVATVMLYSLGNPFICLAMADGEYSRAVKDYKASIKYEETLQNSFLSSISSTGERQAKLEALRKENQEKLARIEELKSVRDQANARMNRKVASLRAAFNPLE